MRSAPLEDGLGYFVQRQYAVHCPALDGHFRHAKHDTGGLILREGARLGIVHFQQTCSTIITHASHDDAQRILAGKLGHGTEQHVD